MKYFSTRNENSKGMELDDVILQGLASDGGLFLPEKVLPIDLDLFSAEDSFQITTEILYGQIAPELSGSVSEVFDFPLTLNKLDDEQYFLELFHGPTAAFKDFGARVLASALGRISSERNIAPTVLVATSGDTGGAVASAFEKVEGVKVVILFPKGGVSPRQEIQLGCWGDNVSALRVEGTFDDCQALVKQAFNDTELRENYLLTSANSINIARVLGQIPYYVWASLQKPNFDYVIPTGNLGNAFACVWAKRLGFPIGKIRLATNANQTLANYFSKGVYETKDSLSTLANAMDVGAPSNFERLVNWFPNVEELKGFGIDVKSVNDDRIVETIKAAPFPICPHSACALSSSFSEKSIIVSTAHPAKFETIVEPLIESKVHLPEALASVLSRPTKFIDIANDFDALEKFISNAL